MDAVYNYYTDLADKIGAIDITTPTRTGKSGSKDGDAYVEAFEKELEKLEDARDNGLISEKEYLDRLRNLYVKYFKDRKEYLDKFRKYEQQYLKGMKSLYESAIGAATSVLNRQLNKLQDQRDDAIKQIEKEQEAAEKAIQKQIDAKQDEIDKIQEASEARQREIDLQKKQYELERLQNQQTRLVYKDGQMVYETDSSGIRDAREEVRQAEEEIQIAAIQKEIDVLEDKLESITEYYENLKESTNEYYDSMIDGIQGMIDKWEELSEKMELAANIEILKSLGISVEDILSGNVAAFDKLKNEYVGVTAALNINNEEFLSSMAKAFGMTEEQLLASAKSFKDFSSGVTDTTSNLDDSTENINNLEGAVEELGNTSSTASGGVKEISDSTKDIATNSKDAGEGLSEVQTSIEQIDAEKVGTLKDYFSEMSTAIGTISSILNGDSGLISGLSGIVTPEILIGLINLVSQFNLLKAAVDSVSSAIGGGSQVAEGGGLATGAYGGAATPTAISGGGSTGSLKDSLKQQVEEAKPLLEEETALFNGEENSLLTGVNDVIGVLTGGEEKPGEGDKVNPETLMGANQIQYNVANDIIPKEVELFEGLEAAIQACVDLLREMASLMEGASGWQTMGTVPIRPYASGTNRAKKGLSIVGEEAPELIEDNKGNLSLASKPTLLNMEGGEKVYNGYETSKMLTPLDESSLPYSMIMKSRSLFNSGLAHNTMSRQVNGMMNAMKSVQPLGASQNVNLSIGDIQVHGVQDVNGLANAISTKLPNTLLQTMTKRK